MRDFNRSAGGNRFGGNRDAGKRSFGGGFGGGRSFDRNSARPEMHKAVCDDCGRNCEVPFKPSGNKEIFCSDCFNKRGGKEGLGNSRPQERNFNRYEDDRSYDFGNDRGNDRGNSRGSDRGEREMFDATCDECGKACKLPFKPSSNKPVFCSQCFEDRGEKAGLHDAPDYKRSQRVDSGEGMSGASRKELGEMRDQLNSVNVKLEKIMKALNIVSAKPAKVEADNAEAGVAVMNELQAILNDDEVSETVEAVEEVKVVEKKVKAPAKKKAVVAKKAVVKKVAAKKAK